MSVLKGFLQPSPMEDTTEVIISARFKGEDGKPLPFKIKKIDQETASAISKQCTKRVKENGVTVEKLDNVKYSNALIVECCLVPDFRDKDMCDFYKVIDPLSVPGRMLSVGEYGRLSQEIMAFNDFDTPEKIEDEAKNS